MAKAAARRQRGRVRQRTVGQKAATFFGYLTTLILLGVLAGVGYTGVLLNSTLKTLPDAEALSDYLPGGATELFTTDKDPATGKPYVLGRVFSQYKEFAPITEIPKTIQNATVAVEDERFYRHVGIDIRGIGRALYRDIQGGKMGEGGSTLTQQLARNVILQNQKKTLRRKIQEAILAVQLEKSYSKEQILQMYLNEVCYGANTYGIKAAAKMFFGKPLAKLSIAESALLVGLPQQPARLDPFDHLPAAIDRRNTVLAKMKEQGYIKPDEYKKALAEKPKIIPEVKHNQADFKAPYFTTYVLRQLVKKYGKEMVYHGGLKVYTTLNYQMQKEAEKAIVEGVREGRGDGVTQGALVSLEPRTGYIRAMVGGTDFKKDQYNAVTQGRRQPGSSFKPFVYTAAFTANHSRFTPDFEINDAPVSFGKYRPKNYDGRFHGYVTLRRALTYSYNVPAVKIADMIGIDRVLDTASAMGIRSLDKPANRRRARNLSTALGAYEVTPLELTSAYSVFSNRGNHAVPMSIIRVVDGEGKVLEATPPQVEQAVVPESVVADVGSMLRDVVDHGTAAGAAGIHEIQDARGKTGTTNDNKDAWFVGYTPELVTSVWVCGVKKVKKKDKIVSVYPPMEGVTGGHICAPIWSRFMKAAVPIQKLAGLPAQPVAVKRGTVAGIDPDAEPSPEATPETRRRRRRERREATEEATESPTPTPAPSVEAIPEPEPDTPGDTTPRAPAPTPDEPENPATAAVTETALQTRSEPSATVAVSRRAAPRPVLTRRAAIPDETTTVATCEETGLRATRWCPVTIDRMFHRGEAPKGRCRRHKPLPGDG